jgi:hypothetical protein
MLLRKRLKGLKLILDLLDVSLKKFMLDNSSLHSLVIFVVDQMRGLVEKETKKLFLLKLVIRDFF